MLFHATSLVRDAHGVQQWLSYIAHVILNFWWLCAMWLSISCVPNSNGAQHAVIFGPHSSACATAGRWKRFPIHSQQLELWSWILVYCITSHVWGWLEWATLIRHWALVMSLDWRGNWMVSWHRCPFLKVFEKCCGASWAAIKARNVNFSTH